MKNIFTVKLAAIALLSTALALIGCPNSIEYRDVEREKEIEKEIEKEVELQISAAIERALAAKTGSEEEGWTVAVSGVNLEYAYLPLIAGIARGIDKGMVKLDLSGCTGEFLYLHSNTTLPPGEASADTIKRYQAITLPQTVEKIGDNVFLNYAALETFSAPGAVTIGATAFSGLAKLETLNLPAVESIGLNAFLNTPWLTEFMEARDFAGVTVLDDAKFKELFGQDFPSLKSVASGYFSGTSSAANRNLTTVNLTGVRIIGDNAFQYCTALTSVTLPAATAIGNNAFQGCNNAGFTALDLPLAETIGNYAFNGCLNITTVTLPEAKSIGNYAFTGGASARLSSVSIPKVESIGNYAFQSNVNPAFTTIDMPQVKTIGNYAFQYCSKLAAITAPAAETIGNNAFQGCASLQSMSLPLAKSIGNSAFTGDTSMTSVNIPLIETLGNNIFENCNNLEEVTLPRLNTMGNDVFKGTAFLADIQDTTRAMTQLTDSSFAPIMAKLPGMKSLPSGFFNGTSGAVNTNLQSINLSSVTSLGDYAFQYCTNLVSVNLPNVENTLGNTFQGCTSLTTVTMPKLVSTGSNTFRDCTSLENLSLPKLKATSSYFLYGCSSLVSVDLPEADKLQYVQNNVTQTMYAIGPSTFYGCTSLTTVNLPKATYINQSAFYNCTSLVTLNLPALENLAGSSIFQECTALAALNIPAVKQLGASSLASIKGSGVTLFITMGMKAPTMTTGPFYGNTGTKTIVIKKPANATGYTEDWEAVLNAQNPAAAANHVTVTVENL